MPERTAPTGGDPRYDCIDRRAALAGAAMLVAGPARSRQDDPPPPPAVATALSVNLLTRMAAGVLLPGRRRALFVLDTGSQRTAIARDLAMALGLPAGPVVLVHGVTAAEAVPTVRVNRLLFGGHRFNDLVMPLFERTALGADGLLGLDVLTRFRLSLDLTRRTVRLSGPGTGVYIQGSAAFTAPRMPGGTRARIDPSGQLIVTNAVADGTPVEAFVDSGGQYSIGNLALLRATGGRIGPRPVRLYGVTGQTIEAFAGHLDRLRIGPHELGPTPLLFADLHAFAPLGLEDGPALLIGADVLYRFRHVELDFAGRRIGFGALQRRQGPPLSATG